MGKKFILKISAIIFLALPLFYFMVSTAGVVFGKTEGNLNYDEIIDAARKSGMTDQEIADMLSEGTETKKSAGITLTYPWSGAKNLIDLVSKFYNIALAAVGVAALGAIVYGGILYTASAGNTSKQAEARSWIGGAIAGLVLLLGAVLLFNTIGIIEGGKLVEPEIASVPETKTTEEKTTEKGPATYSDAGARQLLRTTTDNKITVNSGEPKTSLNNVRQETMSGLFQIWDGCGKCNILITGGTEGGIHAVGDFSHTNGYKLDLSYANSSQQLNDYLRNQIPEFQIDYNKTYLGKDGNKYRLERNDAGIMHWDICFKCP